MADSLSHSSKPRKPELTLGQMKIIRGWAIQDARWHICQADQIGRFISSDLMARYSDRYIRDFRPRL